MTTTQPESHHESIVKKIHCAVIRSGKRTESHYILLGLLGFFGFPFYYVIWNYIYPQPYENLTLRLIASVLCLLLTVKNHWPKKCKPYVHLYWYITLFYCVPFFFNFMFLKNNLNLIWAMSTFAGMFILILVTEWRWLLGLFVSGTICAWLVYLLTGGHAALLTDFLGFSAVYAFTGIVGILFLYNTERLQQKRLLRERLQGMMTLSVNVAHELRTPLLGLKSGTAGLKRYVPKLFETYLHARKQGLEVPRIRTSHANNILPTLDRMDRQTHFANTIIDMLLMNLSHSPIDSSTFEQCGMVVCINAALDRYPFDSTELEAKLHWNKANDFSFLGAPMLLNHMMFNLLKNALHFIVTAERGEIFIWLQCTDTMNELHFKDTGEGIATNIMPQIFDRFFTTTMTGTGVGLSFCKMVMKKFGGDIYCRSTEGKFTEFILVFPPIAT